VGLGVGIIIKGDIQAINRSTFGENICIHQASMTSMQHACVRMIDVRKISDL
jgi:hypothetical protein